MVHHICPPESAWISWKRKQDVMWSCTKPQAFANEACSVE
jgi:hypothetical protein